MQGRPIRIGLKYRPSTQAIVDGRAAEPGLSIVLEDVIATPERHAMLMDGRLDGAEMGFNALVRYRSAGAPLVALPVYLKRGFPHSHIYVSADSPLTDPAQLRGRRVACARYSPNILVGARAVLQHQFGVHPREIRWLESHPPEPGELRPEDVPIQRLLTPAEFVTPGDVAGEEELDARELPLERAEIYLCELLAAGQVDAVINPVGVRSPRVRPLLADDEAETAFYRATGVYPMNHVLAFRSEVLAAKPALAEAVVRLFQESAGRSIEYGGERLRERLARERLKLGGREPFLYVLGAEERHTAETYIGYMLEQGLLAQRLAVEDLFFVGGAAPAAGAVSTAKPPGRPGRPPAPRPGGPRGGLPG